MAAQIGVFLGIVIATLIAPCKDIISGQRLASLDRPSIYMFSVYVQSFLALSLASDLLAFLSFDAMLSDTGQSLLGGRTAYIIAGAPCLGAACRLLFSRSDSAA